MQYITAIILGAASLAAAAPANQNTNSLNKRDGNLCDLTNYPSANQGPIGDAVSYLNHSPPTFWATAGTCTLVSCSYGTGVSYCLDPGASPEHQQIDPAAAASDVSSTYQGCYGGSPGSGGIAAFQHFGGGYNVLVKGGYSC